MIKRRLCPKHDRDVSVQIFLEAVYRDADQVNLIAITIYPHPPSIRDVNVPTYAAQRRNTRAGTTTNTVPHLSAVSIIMMHVGHSSGPSFTHSVHRANILLIERIINTLGPSNQRKTIRSKRRIDVLRTLEQKINSARPTSRPRARSSSSHHTHVI